MAQGPPQTSPPLNRLPDESLTADATKLDEKIIPVLECVSNRLYAQVDSSTDLSEGVGLWTQSLILKAARNTHRGIRLILAQGEAHPELSVEALPLARIQLERCFLGLLVADNDKGKEWADRYRKNGWVASAKAILRHKAIVAHHAPCVDFYAADGECDRTLRKAAEQTGISEAEYQGVEQKLFPRTEEGNAASTKIPRMPSPGEICTKHLKHNPQFQGLAGLLYPWYDNLSHFTHSGSVGAFNVAMLGEEITPPDSHPQVSKDKLWYRHTVDPTLPASYVSMLFLTALFALPSRGDAELMGGITNAWSPEICDGTALGILVWDNWARSALGAIK